MRKVREIGAVVFMAMLLLLAGAYVGAYLSLSEPTGSITQHRDGSIDFELGDRFSGGGRFAEAIFRPLTWLDMRLRPERWGTTYIPPDHRYP